MNKSLAKIRFKKSGLISSVQDHGRFGFADYGVPYSGAMDQFSYNLANLLLNNDDDAAVLEMAIIGPEMIFEMPTTIVFTGAQVEIFVNGTPQPIGKLLALQHNDVVKVGRFKKGQWLYMGIKGGIQTPRYLESRSWFEGISDHKVVKNNISLPYKVFFENKEHPKSHPKLTSNWFETNTIDVYRGADWDKIPKSIIRKLSEQNFTIGNQVNRMGIQLETNLSHQIPNILTSPVYPGTVQLTPSGNIIILMRDAQVTGGYPRILQLTDQSINIVAQKTNSDVLNFKILNY
ncbi:biotin-dependent carboxyltransferase family protein [Belliella sp. DSM 111904]|uniref:Biotin-dependent carboxyltransferase family protein n=1 Tax=Belliella filtrata TaxID=2923435 RepID=A0ABS9V4I3_9BACT|nr:biotin-dependent carboxyltransferase family protein [Belliella filtrata]MCH7410888.1 biotin-dependent carboxyltransferase family protein [Belliella filtrata]